LINGTLSERRVTRINFNRILFGTAAYFLGHPVYAGAIHNILLRVVNVIIAGGVDHCHQREKPSYKDVLTHLLILIVEH